MCGSGTAQAIGRQAGNDYGAEFFMTPLRRLVANRFTLSTLNTALESLQSRAYRWRAFVGFLAGVHYGRTCRAQVGLG